MPRFFNTLDSPVLYNDNGQTLDGYAWLESEATPQIVAALKRKELIEVDSEGNIVDNSINKEPEDTEDTPKKSNSRKKLEG